MFNQNPRKRVDILELLWKLFFWVLLFNVLEETSLIWNLMLKSQVITLIKNIVIMHLLYEKQ